jgi:predicted RNase H-like HicB family nuclease
MQRQYLILIERGAPGENLSAYCPDVDGCVATGATVEEAQAAMAEALRFHLRSMADDGDTLPQSTHVSSAVVVVDVPEHVEAGT